MKRALIALALAAVAAAPGVARAEIRPVFSGKGPSGYVYVPDKERPNTTAAQKRATFSSDAEDRCAGRPRFSGVEWRNIFPKWPVVYTRVRPPCASAGERR